MAGEVQAVISDERGRRTELTADRQIEASVYVFGLEGTLIVRLRVTGDGAICVTAQEYNQMAITLWEGEAHPSRIAKDITIQQHRGTDARQL